MTDFLDRIGLTHPVVQAGMGGGVVGAELAAAVSAAGALGTVGIMPVGRFRAELLRAREMASGRPVAANVIVPFTRDAHVQACIEAGVVLVVLHGGIGRRWFGALHDAGVLVFPTVGSEEQARAALAAGADGLVVQGVEAGGHLMGDTPLAALLPRVRDLAGDVPLLAAGGIADGSDVRRVLAEGATAAVAGTRFLLTHESRAHPAYKTRVLNAPRTLRTMLFGLGWPLEHRVIPNAATERWCGPNGEVSRWVRWTERAAAPLLQALPLRAGNVSTSLQRAAMPLFGPTLPVVGMPDSAVDTSALYAGETLHKISGIVSAAEAVASLV